MKKTIANVFLVLMVSLGLVACGESEQTQVDLDPIAIHSGDECHVCGMIIQEWPGPKGEVINAKTGQVLKFCSTADMFSWVLQPENKNLKAAIYVHDMTQNHWDKPNDEHLIDARTAWYVMGSDKMGMGPTFATFATEQAAQEFTQKHGGEVLAWDDITIDTLRAITRLGIEYYMQHDDQPGVEHEHEQHQEQHQEQHMHH